MGVMMAHDHEIRPYLKKRLFLELGITAFPTGTAILVFTKKYAWSTSGA
jgi:hypothetical protein